MLKRTGLWMLGVVSVLGWMGAAWSWGWVGVPPAPWHAFPTPAARPDSGVELRAMMRRDTIPAGHRGPVELLYFIVNGPRRTRFDNDPERYSIRVERPGGQGVPPVWFSHPPLGTWGPQATMVLPAGAFLGQVQDLRCTGADGYATNPATPRAPGCRAMWEFHAPGTYHVIVEYHGPTPRAWLDSVMADTGRIDPAAPRPPRLHLTDTATLVVTSR